MSAPLNIHDGTGKVVMIGNQDFLLTGPTVPTDGQAGFLPGCIFMKNLANGVGSTMYVNEGSLTSCDFNAK